MVWLQDWVRTIIILVFFAGFLELLLPSGNMKPMVQVLVGLFVLILLLGPVSALVDQIQNQTEPGLPRIAEAETDEVLARGKDLEQQQLQQVLTQYRTNIEQQVLWLLRSQDETVRAAVTVDVADRANGVDFGQLRSLTVVLQADKQQREQVNTESIATFLADFYGLAKDKVAVSWID